MEFYVFYEEENLSDNWVNFDLINRLNQDALENLFRVMRQEGGYNKNPTARTIRTSIRSTCIFHCALLKKRTARIGRRRVK